MFKNLTMLLCAAIMLGCSEDPESLDPNSTSFEIPVFQQDGLEGIVVELATNKDWSTVAAIEALRKNRKLKFENAIINNKDFQSLLFQTGQDGGLVKFDVIMEMDDRVSVDMLPSGSLASGRVMQKKPYRVALDPDEYYFPSDIEEEDLDVLPDIELPTLYYDGINPEPTKEVIILNDKTEFSEPMFYVSVVPQRDESSLKNGRQKVELSGTFLTFVGAEVHKSHDSGGEEFELYFSDAEDPLTEPVNTTTDHEFNGGSRKDVSGRLRNYPDITNQQGMQIADSPIAIRRTSSTAFRIIAIEDDNKNQSVGPGVYQRTSSNLTSHKDIDYYDLTDNLIKANTTTKFIHKKTSNNNDDRYVDSGVTAITNAKLITQLGGRSWFATDEATGSPGDLSDVNWRLGREVY